MQQHSISLHMYKIRPQSIAQAHKRAPIQITLARWVGTQSDTRMDAMRALISEPEIKQSHHIAIDLADSSFFFRPSLGAFLVFGVREWGERERGRNEIHHSLCM